MDLLKQQAELNPPGTKILIEVEIVNQDGHNGLTSIMFNNDNMEAFHKLTGCVVNRIYNKTVTATTDIGSVHIDTMIDSISEKIKLLRSQGVEI